MSDFPAMAKPLLIAPDSSSNNLVSLSCWQREELKMATLDAILAGKYPAKAHARRVAGYLHERGYGGPGVIYLEAQKTRLIEDNDEAMPFRYVLPYY